MSKLIFRIYIAGLNAKNNELVATFEEVCISRFPSGSFAINTVDITRTPSMAESNKILATPTIIREKPLPEKRIIGDFREDNKAQQAINFLTEDLNKR